MSPDLTISGLKRWWWAFAGLLVLCVLGLVVGRLFLNSWVPAQNLPPLSREEIEARWPIEGNSERPYQGVVRGLRQQPFATRLNYYLSLARELQLPVKYRPGDKNNLHVLTRELAAEEELALLESLESSLDRPRQKVIWYVLDLWMGNPLSRESDLRRAGEARDLLEKWAVDHPDAISLAEHRADGVEALVRQVENEALDISERNYYLGRIVWLVRLRDRRQPRALRDKAVVAQLRTEFIPRLQKFAKDPTPIDWPTRRTFGEAVCECIAEIEKLHE